MTLANHLHSGQEARKDPHVRLAEEAAKAKVLIKLSIRTRRNVRKRALVGQMGAQMVIPQKLRRSRLRLTRTVHLTLKTVASMSKILDHRLTAEFP